MTAVATRRPMLQVPGGRVAAGSTAGDVRRLVAECPGLREEWFAAEVGRPAVDVAPFLLAPVPVTNEEFAAFVDAGGYRAGDAWSDEGRRWLARSGRDRPRFWSPAWPGWDAPDHPVVGVTWFEADAYARWAGARLPTEAEWEWAARGPEGRRLPWGDEPAAGLANTAERVAGRPLAGVDDWVEHVVERRPWRDRCLTTPVGSFPAGRSHCGALDLAGNVWEWCADEFVPPWGRRPGLDHRSCRGGSFGYPWWWARGAERGHHPPWWSALGLGFRCAADAPGGRP